MKPNDRYLKRDGSYGVIKAIAPDGSVATSETADNGRTWHLTTYTCDEVCSLTHIETVGDHYFRFGEKL